jgi:hypothetical protein
VVSFAVFAIVFALFRFILESSSVCCLARSNARPIASMFPNKISLLILVAAETFSATLLTDLIYIIQSFILIIY